MTFEELARTIAHRTLCAIERSDDDGYTFACLHDNGGHIPVCDEAFYAALAALRQVLSGKPFADHDPETNDA